MKQPTEAQVKELWEWCGLKVIQVADDHLMLKNEKGHTSWINLDLNNLFRYAVPAIDGSILLSTYHTGEWLVVIEYYAKDDTRKCVSHHLDPALALFWAIQEVIKKEAK